MIVYNHHFLRSVSQLASYLLHGTTQTTGRKGEENENAAWINICVIPHVGFRCADRDNRESRNGSVGISRTQRTGYRKR